MNKNNEIDQYFKQGLGEFTPTPPSYVWDRIASVLASQKRAKRRAIIWWSSAASVAVVMTLGGLWFIGSYRPVSDNELFVSDVMSTEAPLTNRAKNTVVVSQDDQAEPSLEVVNELDEPTIHRGAAQRREEPVKADLLSVAVSRIRIDAMANPHALLSLPSRGVSVGSEFSVASVSVKPLATQAREEQKRLFTESLLMASSYPAASAEQKKEIALVLGGIASPSFSHHADSRVKSSARSSQSDEAGLLTVGGGLNMRIETRSRWSFESGVLYSRIGQSEETGSRPPLLMATSSAVVTDGSSMPHGNSMGVIKVKSTGMQSSSMDNEMITYSPQRYGGYQGDIRQLLDYIEVPLIARYRLIDRQLALSLTGGFSANFLADNNAYLVDGSKKTYIGYTQGMDDFSVSSSLGLSFEVPVFKSLFFNMEPRFKYFLTPANPDTGYTPYSFSMLAGFAIRF